MLKLRSNSSSVGILLKLDGMDPWMLFCESKSQVREEKFAREEGMVPERLFSDRIRISSGEEICTTVDWWYRSNKVIDSKG